MICSWDISRRLTLSSLRCTTQGHGWPQFWAKILGQKIWYMWCDQTKWVLWQALSNFTFLVYLVKQTESFVLLKTSSKSDVWFQWYIQFCPAEINKIQKEFHWMYCKFNIPNIRLIPLDHFTYIACSRSILLHGMLRKHSKHTYITLKLIQTRAENNQRWWWIQNPFIFLFPKEFMHAIWETVYAMKG